MWLGLAGTALFMGLAGGPHCLAMCAAPCGALARGGSFTARTDAAAGLGMRPVVSSRAIAFHMGRLLGYALAGGLAAWAVERLVALIQVTAVLRPAWTLLHVAVLAWGLSLVLLARQPAWVDEAGRSVWRRIQPAVAARRGVWMAGMAWALMPCGLLYSALLVAGLSGSPLRGGLTMALFGIGSGAWLLVGPWAWAHLRSHMNALRSGWGTRFAGVVLVTMGAWALWMDVMHQQPTFWCFY